MAIKLRALVKHPSQVEGDTGLTVTKANGIVTVSLDLGTFSETPAVADTSLTTVLLVTPGTPDVVERMAIDDLFSAAPSVAAEYLVAAASGALSAERVATDTATVAWDFATAAQAKANVPNDAVTDAKLRNSGALSVIGRSANSSGDPADISATPASDAVLRESGSVIGFGTIATGGVANDAITDAKLRNSGALSVVGRTANSSGDPADISATAATDAVLRESGSLLGFGTIATGGIANSAITDAKIRNSAALSVIGRSANSSGAVTDISATAASGGVLRESGSVIGFGTVAVAGGGTGLTAGTSGGVPFFNSTSTIASSAALGAGLVVVGGGAGATPATIANGQLPATATNDAAAAGKVGEYIEAAIAVGSATSLTSTTPANLTSISLTAGDWDVWINPVFGGTTVSVAGLRASISLTTNTEDTATVGRFLSQTFNSTSAFATFNRAMGSANCRMSLSATTTVYFVGRADFSGGTCTGYGLIAARRAR